MERRDLIRVLAELAECPLCHALRCAVPNSTDAEMPDVPTSIFLGVEGLKKALLQCGSKDELQDIYQDNRERIERSAELTELVEKVNRANWLIG